MKYQIYPTRSNVIDNLSTVYIKRIYRNCQSQFCREIGILLEMIKKNNNKLKIEKGNGCLASLHHVLSGLNSIKELFKKFILYVVIRYDELFNRCCVIILSYIYVVKLN